MERGKRVYRDERDYRERTKWVRRQREAVARVWE